MGILFSLSGLDGSGKSTQTNRLTNMCREYGINVNSVHLKMVDSYLYLSNIAKKIRVYLRKNRLQSADEIHNMISSLIFSEKVDQGILPSLSMYEVTIVDRYCDSAMCYHYLRNELNTSIIKLYEELRIPDINIYLDLKPDECYKRILKRDFIGLYETLESLERAYYFYQSIRGRFIIVDGAKTEEEITQILFSYILKKLEDERRDSSREVKAEV